MKHLVGRALFSLTVNSGAKHTVAGTLTVSSKGMLTLNGGGTVTTTMLNIAPQGQLLGNGLITANVQNSGIIAPSGVTGGLYIDGNYTQTATGTLQMALAGATAGIGYDPLVVSGTPTLGGTFQVLLAGAFTPEIGDRFNIFEGGASSGGFLSVLLPPLSGHSLWDTRLLDSEGILSVIDNRYLPGDFNRDGQVTVADISKMMTALTNIDFYQSFLGMSNQQFMQIADVNDDSLVNNADIQALITLIANNAALGSGGDLTTVPEPASIGLLGFGGLLLAVGCRLRTADTNVFGTSGNALLRTTW